MRECDYANARVRGMRSHLLGAKGIRALLAQPDFDARLEFLKQTDYGEAIAAQLTRAPDALRGVERGLRARARQDLVAVDRFLGGARARELLRAVLAFEDGWSLKTILRGLAAGEAAERLLDLLDPTPGFDEPALALLVAQREIAGVVDLLATWGHPLATPLRAALPAWSGRRDLFPLELAVDRALFAGALAVARRHGAEGRAVLAFVETQIDLTNAAILLGGLGGRLGLDAFIPGGRHIDDRRLRELATLPETSRRGALTRDLRPLRVTMDALADPFTADQRLRAALREGMRGLARTEPLSIAVPLAFFLERDAEVSRIRLVLRGAAFGLPADRLLELAES